MSILSLFIVLGLSPLYCMFIFCFGRHILTRQTHKEITVQVDHVRCISIHSDLSLSLSLSLSLRIQTYAQLPSVTPPPPPPSSSSPGVLRTSLATYESAEQ